MTEATDPSSSGLGDYERRRDTAVSGEPTSGSRSRPSWAGDGPVFVVQRHDASSLHFDLRLEIEGVLVSWAVPKGPSVDPREKRLATRTEDHPLDYGGFEGRIEEGYGAGTVIIWDRGPLTNATMEDGEAVPLRDALARGHLRVTLHGEKLSGDIALTHTRTGGDEDAWLLVKVDDAGADRRRRPTSTQPGSVVSGRTNRDLEGS